MLSPGVAAGGLRKELFEQVAQAFSAATADGGRTKTGGGNVSASAHPFVQLGDRSLHLRSLLGNAEEQQPPGAPAAPADHMDPVEALAGVGPLGPDWQPVLEGLLRAQAQVVAAPRDPALPHFRRVSRHSIMFDPALVGGGVAMELAAFAAGRVVGLALLHGQTLGLALTPCLVKLLAGEPVTPVDLAALDPVWFKNRVVGLVADADGLEQAKLALCVDRLCFVAELPGTTAEVPLCEVSANPASSLRC